MDIFAVITILRMREDTVGKVPTLRLENCDLALRANSPKLTFWFGRRETGNKEKSEEKESRSKERGIKENGGGALYVAVDISHTHTRTHVQGIKESHYNAFITRTKAAEETQTQKEQLVTRL